MVDIHRRHALELSMRHFPRETEQGRERNVKGVANQNRIINRHLSLMEDKPAQTVVWQATVGMLAVDQSQKSNYSELPVLQYFPHVVHGYAGD
ncbi:hypothetical protein GT781_02250 [Bifidobacterium pseudocatenulatum]|nr:hypothetical protein [Bifidobacterium pseudocatenulatum]MZN02548.1 hypothetical protein [Bifidobacterium pseudocatenulatum]MZN26546.1 hypothetical protein [Bifidobacterium pseudocatenulatum]MZN43376.1 hypothetical protein [Bifidobacterium pseudocatenulatum]MZN50150.1 hypothetical protein [Bifidobacterium pseudocatenulatum]